MTNLADYEYDIFLSYSHHDEAWTKRLAARLEREPWPAQGRNVRVFFAPWDIRPGQSIPRRLQDALPRSRKVGLVLSPESVDSAWVELESFVTTYIDKTERQERLIPLHRRTCDIPALLLPILSIDFRDDADFEASYQLLLCTIKGEPLPRGEQLQTDDTAALMSEIPRPPMIGFVARRDAAGRDIVERLKELLAPRQNNLVTLSGPGGVGKTTLAAEAARELLEAFAGRVVWSSADGRPDFTLSTLLDDTATQLGRADLRQRAPDAKAAEVHALVANPPTLVVLDNYETIEASAQERIKDWLTHAHCSALFTSRPQVGSLGATLNIVVEAMSRKEAQEFLKKVITQTQDAQVFSANVRQRIYKTAEANPFVMQWVVGQIDAAQEPQTVFEELQQGAGDAAQRVFDRSFNLPQLGDDGRAALLALSLFSPNATRSALAEVAGFDNDSRRLNNALKNLRALWLIKALDENKRFTIEGLTRSQASARLSKDPRAADFRQRFVAYFRLYARAHRQRTPADYDALEAERENLLSAIDVASAAGDWQSVQNIADIVAKLVGGVLGVRGYWDDAIRCNEQAMAAAREANDKGAIARFSGNNATIRQNRGEYDEARQAHQQALITFKTLGDDRNVAVALHQLGRLAQDQGEIEEARRLYNESLEIKKHLGNQSSIASTLHQLGRLAQDQGEIEEARQLYNKSLEIKKRVGDQRGIASTLQQLGKLAQVQGEMEEARRLYNESLEIKKKLGHQSGIAITLHELAILAQSQGETEEARRLFSESLEIKRRVGDQRGIASTLHNLALLAEMKGNRDEAVKLMRAALVIFEKLKSPIAEKAWRILKKLEGESS